MGIQVCSLMWLRTTMNYQYRYGNLRTCTTFFFCPCVASALPVRWFFRNNYAQLGSFGPLRAAKQNNSTQITCRHDHDPGFEGPVQGRRSVAFLQRTCTRKAHNANGSPCVRTLNLRSFWPCVVSVALITILNNQSIRVLCLFTGSLARSPFPLWRYCRQRWCSCSFGCHS